MPEAVNALTNSPFSRGRRITADEVGRRRLVFPHAGAMWPSVKPLPLVRARTSLAPDPRPLHWLGGVQLRCYLGGGHSR